MIKTPNFNIKKYIIIPYSISTSWYGVSISLKFNFKWLTLLKILEV